LVKSVFFGQSRFWHCDLARLSMPSPIGRRTSFSGQSSRGDCGLSRGSRLFLDRGREAAWEEHGKIRAFQAAFGKQRPIEIIAEFSRPSVP
jgi:hypothetical protein